MGLGVDGSGGGADPETERFWLVVGVGRGVSKGPSNTTLSPMNMAADMKYWALRFLTTVVISASWEVALWLIWSAFQTRHFSSRSIVANLARFFSVLTLMS